MTGEPAGFESDGSEFDDPEYSPDHDDRDVFGDDAGGWDAGYAHLHAHLEAVLRAYTEAEEDDPERARLRDILVTGYLPVAHNVARRYAHRGEPLDDLEQVAGIGLLNAILRFEPDQGRHFLAFAVPTITGEIRRHFRDRTWSLRIPRRLKDLYIAINTESAQLHQQLGRAPRPSEIAARLGVRTEEILEGLLASQAYRSYSLDGVLAEDDEHTTLHNMLGVDDTRFEKIIDSRALATHLAALPRRERDILMMRFFDDMTQSEIGERVGISQMHVSRVLAATLVRLRDAVEDDPAAAVRPARSRT